LAPKSIQTFPLSITLNIRWCGSSSRGRSSNGRSAWQTASPSIQCDGNCNAGRFPSPSKEPSHTQLARLRDVDEAAANFYIALRRLLGASPQLESLSVNIEAVLAAAKNMALVRK
jgi:hypothetical protein